MKLIESKVEYIPQEPGLEGIYKQIELAGRTCYKSEDKITKDSAKKFVDRMIDSNHLAMLEHGTVYLYLEVNKDNATSKFEYLLSGYTAHYNWRDVVGSIRARYASNKYSRAFSMIDEDGIYKVYIVTNLRVIYENKWFDDLQFICEPTEFHERRITLKFTTSIGVTRELVRHRVFSFANESTRYCNYSMDKFDKEVTFIKPSWFKEHQLSMDTEVAQSSKTNGAVFYERPYKAYWIDTDAEGFDWYKEDFFIHSCLTAKQCYLLMLEEGATPQQAREVLPLCTKSDIVMTGFASDWKHFFDLRLLGTTGKPHPDMLLLAEKAKKVLEENNLWNLIYKE